MCRILTLISSPDSDGIKACEQSFDFSKFPNLQAVDFGVGWIEGSPYWIPMALSTLKPATSPRLSSIRLDFTPVIDRNVPSHLRAMIEVMADDLRRAADEVTRIKREFKGVVDVNVVRAPWMGVALDEFSVSFRSCGVHQEKGDCLMNPVWNCKGLLT